MENSLTAIPYSPPVTLPDRRILIFSALLLAALVGFGSIVGIFSEEFYKRESLNAQLQAVGQDVFNLILLVPFLIFSAVSLKLKQQAGMVIWGAAVLYTVYTFSIYCFDVHFNRLFLVYCLTLGVSGYALLYFLFYYLRHPLSGKTSKSYPSRFIGIYFIIISLCFAALWLADIVPAVMADRVPVQLGSVNLPTNPVHVLDLSFALPGILLTGIGLLRKSRLAFLVAPVWLTFLVLMNLTIAFLMVLLKMQGQEGSYSVAGIMGGLSVVSLILLTVYPHVWALRKY